MEARILEVDVAGLGLGVQQLEQKVMHLDRGALHELEDLRLRSWLWLRLRLSLSLSRCSSCVTAGWLVARFRVFVS